MNANELADELTELIVAPTPVDDKWACELIDQSATMLRQLQSENEALKKERDLLFKAHSAEMKRADELKAELEDLYDKAPLDWENE